MPSAAILAKKQKYFDKLEKLIVEYPTVMLCQADNVGSRHMAAIRKDLRGKAELLMGKNTMIRKFLRGFMTEKPELEALLPCVEGNVGFIFTKGDAAEVREIVENNVVGAPAKAGAIAPCDVIVPPGPTGLEPGQTSFMQALSIPTKIARNQIEILKEVSLLTTGDKVGSSEAALLQKLNIMPFTYGLKITTVFDDGAVYDASLLDINSKDVEAMIAEAVTNIACLSLELGVPTMAAVPHYVMGGIKNLLAIAAETEITFAAAEQLKAYLADPSAFASAAPAGGSGGGGDSAAAEAAPAESESESDDDMGFGLFD